MELRKFNIQFFADGDDDFDLDSIMNEFEQTLTDDEPEDVETEEEETQGEEEEEETPNDDNTQTEDNSDYQDEQQQQQDQTPPPPNDTAQDNGRWKEMRLQAEKARQYEDALSRIAQANGVTTDQLMTQLQERQLEVEAEQNGVPVEIQRRLNDLEARNEQSDRERVLSLMDSDIHNLTKEYGLQAENDPMIQNAFNYIAQNGYVDARKLPTIRFQDAFFIANKDAIAKKQADTLIQKELAAKKQRQSAAIPASNSGTSNSSNAIDDEELTKQVLKDLEDYL